MTEKAVQAPVGFGRQLARALSNVLLGMALGLLAYYFATDVFSRVEQSDLMAGLPTADLQWAEASVEPTTPVLDFEGWESEDEAYWKSLKDGKVFGRLESKDMGIDLAVVKGTTRSALRKGPGWIKYTDLPGPTGNVGVAGHRTTYGAPFRKINKLRKGDTIVFYSPFRVYTYKVVKRFTVTPDRVDVMDTTDKPSLTMTACHPPYSARLRMIVRSELVSVQRVEE